MCKEYGYEHSLVSERGKGVRETMAEKAMKAKNQRTWKDELRTVSYTHLDVYKRHIQAGYYVGDIFASIINIYHHTHSR